MVFCLNTIRFYIILKLYLCLAAEVLRLNTIRFYIILKLYLCLATEVLRLNTIRFYIILKHCYQSFLLMAGLNTIRFYIILKLHRHRHQPCLFEYYTFLHHSQTMECLGTITKSFEYYTFLHHSQTSNSKMKCLTRTYIIVFNLF